LTIKGDGSQRRDFTYVKDIVSAMVYGAEHGVTGTFHLGTGKNHSVNEIAETIDPGGLRKSLSIGLGDYPVTLADNRKARKELNFKPTTNIIDWLLVQKYKMKDTTSSTLPSNTNVVYSTKEKELTS